MARRALPRPAGKPSHALLAGRGLIGWVFLFAAALVFTQALRGPASAIFFTFVLMLPLFMLLYLLTARAALKVYLVADDMTTEKNVPFNYEFRIINEGPLPYPFADAYVRLPQENRVRCAERAMRMALSPLSTYHLHNRVFFAYRGTYEIGVSCIYVYDFFRLFGLRVDFDLYDTVYVTPRRLTTPDSEAAAASDAVESLQRSRSSYDRLEVSDVREYQLGDTLKSIHWKLTARADEPIVREYNAGQTQTVYIYCDLAAKFPSEAPPEEPKPKKKRKKKAEAEAAEADDPLKRDPFALSCAADYEDMNEFAADGVVELAVAAVLRELRRGNRVVLLWYDDRAKQGAFAETLDSPEDFETIWKVFATAPLCAANDAVTRLPSILSEIQSAKQIFVTAHLDSNALADFCALPGVGDAQGSVELVFYNPQKRYANTEARRSFLDMCAARLAEAGVLYNESDER
ncbi:MAG: DUF58 domain-containing protein [Clostridia bacterium]|nr:DUF58 domain-containing protein [Clostridia bacterium]